MRPAGVVKLVALAAVFATHGAFAQLQLERVDPSKDPFNILRNRPESESPQIIADLVRERNRVPPPYLFELARRLWPSDRAGAFEYYALGMIRARYDALRCRDPSSHQGISFLPMAAQNVAQGIDPNRAAFGEAGKRALARPDLFESQVPPMWICIHGMAAINSAMRKMPYGPAEAYTPESEWPALREKLRADYAQYFDEQGKPQDDPIALSKQDFARTVVPGAFAGVWLNDRQIVFTSGKQVSLWTAGGAVEPLGAHDGNWCAGNGVVAWQTGREQIEKQLFRIRYVIGAPGRMIEGSITQRPPFTWARMGQSTMISWGLQANAVRQSRFDCRWVESAKLSGEKGDGQWMPLLPGHGFVQFSRAPGQYGAISYLATEESAPVPLPIPASAQVTPEAFQWFAYRGAYLVAPVWVRRSAAPDAKCANVWWLHPGGKTEEVCLPIDSANQSNAVLFAPSRAGWLRMSSERNTPHGPKTGGVYLTRESGTVEKILESRALGAAVSPDGCSAAVLHNDGKEQKLEVLTLCR